MTFGTQPLRSDEIEIFATGSADPKTRESRLARLVAWFSRATAPTGRIVGACAIAAGANLIGLPAVVGVPVAIATMTLPRRLRLLPKRSSRQTLRQIVGMLILLLLAATSWSYTGYLTADGAATFGVRTADWMRDHYMSPIVDEIELRLYGRNGPTGGAVSIDQLPAVARLGAVAASPTSPSHLAPPTITGVAPGLTGEGVWIPNTRLVDGAPVTFTTFLRPDPAYTDVVAAAVWFDPATTTLVYAPGTKEPGSQGWAWNSGIPKSERANLIAAFNSGFKFKDTSGGVYTEGKTPYPLVDGQASLAIYADGHTDIGTWGSQLTMTPDTVTVRQNLKMIVQDGKPVDGVTSSIKGEWGKRVWQIGFTRRSGIGVTADGSLIYVAGSNLTTETLANALARTGSIRAMELDIHSKHPSFNFFDPAPGTSELVSGTKLLPDMQREATRYLDPDQRDFFALVLR